MSNAWLASWESGNRAGSDFTESRVIVITGMLEDNIVIPYKNIRDLDKCTQSFMPIGIVITHEDPETGEEKDRPDRFDETRPMDEFHGGKSRDFSLIEMNGPAQPITKLRQGKTASGVFCFFG